jgi:hypothetical protein
MDPQPPADTLRSLRITLQKLEQNFDADGDASAMAELKRILLNRIAELELVGTLESRNGDQNGHRADTPDPSELPALTQSAATDGSPQTLAKIDPEKLD